MIKIFVMKIQSSVSYQTDVMYAININNYIQTNANYQSNKKKIPRSVYLKKREKKWLTKNDSILYIIKKKIPPELVTSCLSVSLARIILFKQCG